MRKFYFFLTGLFLSVPSFSFAQTDTLYALETRIMKGDKTALREIAVYLDSKRVVTEFLGYHIMHPTEHEIASRIISENCLFLQHELSLADSLTTKTFIRFLDKYSNKIVFSPVANAFLVTPLSEWPVEYEVRELTENKKKELQNRAGELQQLDWIMYTDVVQHMAHKSPKALLEIASLFYKDRDRYNRYAFDEEDYLDVLRLLTGIEVGVKGEEGKIIYHFDSDYYATGKLNLLIYWEKQYSEYSWDYGENRFVNRKSNVIAPKKEEQLFELLFSEADSAAVNAYVQLTECDTLLVWKLADEYDQRFTKPNYILPVFPYKFIKQLVIFTEYCRRNGIDYKGSSSLQSDIQKLRSGMPYPERYLFENELIGKLTWDDITAVEYWGLVYENNGSYTYSVGKILDKFYSVHRDEMISDPRRLETYLFKSYIFNKLGIIGSCNLYTHKFINTPDSLLIPALKHITTSDRRVREQVAAVLKMDRKLKPFSATEKKEWNGNQDYPPFDLKKEFQQIIGSDTAQESRNKSIVKLIAKIRYEQIGEAITLLEDVPFKYASSKYNFIDRDFGFPVFDMDKKEVRDEFLKLYSSKSEYELYAFYLDENQTGYRTADGSLNYPVLYDILKYDIVDAFVGGGGGHREKEAYLVIKLLELTHKTTLGFPQKLCNSENVWGCSSRKRANAWMHYLEEKGLIQPGPYAPVSFTYGLN